MKYPNRPDIDFILSSTRSVRKKLDYSRPISEEDLVACVNVAVQAPTGIIGENWRFLILTDKDRKADVAKLYREILIEISTNRGITLKSSHLALMDRLPEIPCMIFVLAIGEPGSSVSEQVGFYGSILPAAWSMMVAMRARGLGANVIVTEVDPLAALRAVMDGYKVMTMDDAAPLGDIFCTATGMKDIIVERHFARMKDGAIVSNTGHYDCEIDVVALENLSTSVRTIRKDNEEFTLGNGNKIHLLARGRLVNLAAAEGHPSEVMDMSFANQFLSLCRLAAEAKDMDNNVYDITIEQDQNLATTKLETIGVSIDTLTADQIDYKDDYTAGT